MVFWKEDNYEVSFYLLLCKAQTKIVEILEIENLARQDQDERQNTTIELGGRNGPDTSHATVRTEPRLQRVPRQRLIVAINPVSLHESILSSPQVSIGGQASVSPHCFPLRLLLHSFCFIYFSIFHLFLFTSTRLEPGACFIFKSPLFFFFCGTTPLLA